MTGANHEVESHIEAKTLADHSDPKNLIIILVLLWIMPQFMANRTINPKFTKAQKVQYKQEDERKNKHHSYTALKCDLVQMTKDGKPVVRPEYGTVYQHQGMLLQNLHRRYSYNCHM